MQSLLASIILRFPWLIIALTVIVTIFFGYNARKVKFFFDPDDIMPQNHPYILLKDKIEEYFGGNNTTIVGLQVTEGTIYNPATLHKVKRITEKILDMDGVIPSQVVSLAARKVKDIRGTEEGMGVNKMMEEVPETPKGLDRLRKAVSSNPMYLGTLVSRDEKTVAILSDFTEDTYNVAIYRRILEIVEQEEDANTRIYIGGITAHMYWLDYYSRQMPIFFTGALLIILFLLLAAFRSFRGMVLPLLSSLMSVLWALGIMGIIKFPLDGFNVMAPILILGVGSSHSIQIISRFYEEFLKVEDRAKAVRLTLRGISKAALIAVLTDAAGFATLIIFPLRSIRGFGLITGFGLISILVTSLTFIPACLAVMRPPRKMSISESKGVLTKILSYLAEVFLGPNRRYLIIMLFLIFTFSLWGVFYVIPESNFTTIFKEESRLRRDDKALNAALAGTTTFIILVEGKDQDSIKEPAILKAMEGLQQFLESKPYVGDSWSIVDFLRQMNKAMHADDPAFEKLPENRNLIFQYLLLYSMSGDPEDFDNVVDYDYRMAVIQTFLRDYSTATAKELIGEANQYVEQHFPAGYTLGIASGSSPVTAALNEVMVRGQIWNIIQVSIVIFVLCALIFRSVVGGLLTLIPLVFAVLINFGVMGWTEIWLSIGTATIAAMGIGIGVDYAIYILSRFREEWKATGDIHHSLV
jgi:predicted RND superfamily exporter protein